jgi:hypothetical protein
MMFWKENHTNSDENNDGIKVEIEISVLVKIMLMM